jgi:hypothetical protein
VTTPYIQLHCHQGDCPCGSTGIVSYLSIEGLPVTEAICPVCFKTVARKAIARLFRKTKQRKTVRGK